MIDFIDKSSENVGTPLNRANMMGLQGFGNKRTVFNDDGSIVETNAEGHTTKTVFDQDGSITITFTGEKTISKRITFNSDGSVSEVVL